MREQRAQHTIPPRASRTVANPHRAGHSAGIHPEDQPYNSSEIENEDSYYPQRMPSSARRYTTTEGHQVIQQGNKRIVIHEEPPPRKRKTHWLLLIGIGMMLMFLMYVGATALLNWWTNHQLDATYGMPRTYQVDQYVGIGDSPDHPSHFIFLNLRGRVEIIDLPGGDGAHAKIYMSATLLSDSEASIPVTGEFEDLGNGKIDMIVHIGDQRIIYLNDGTQFKPQQ